MQGRAPTIVTFGRLGPAYQALVARLQRGQQWLTTEHVRWLAGDPAAAPDHVYSAQSACWDQLERVFRASGYGLCIWGPRHRCPDAAPARCDGCLATGQRLW